MIPETVLRQSALPARPFGQTEKEGQKNHQTEYDFPKSGFSLGHFPQLLSAGTLSKVVIDNIIIKLLAPVNQPLENDGYFTYPAKNQNNGWHFYKTVIYSNIF